MKILAILQNAYTDPRRAAILREMLSFTIAKENLTGKKLYKLTEGHELRVANACPEVFNTVKERGKTDLERLRRSVREYYYDLYISCGKQSNEACLNIIDEFSDKPLIIMPHPASRNLTNALIGGVRESIRQVHHSTFNNLSALSAYKTYEFKQLKCSWELNTTNRKAS